MVPASDQTHSLWQRLAVLSCFVCCTVRERPWQISIKQIKGDEDVIATSHNGGEVCYYSPSASDTWCIPAIIYFFLTYPLCLKLSFILDLHQFCFSFPTIVLSRIFRLFIPAFFLFCLFFSFCLHLLIIITTQSCMLTGVQVSFCPVS